MSDRLLHTKVSKKKPLNHFPKKEDGHDGDMQIVSIQGKGTYLCVKDKSDWKISEKFNPRNKFDTHIFDEITTRKIKSSGGLAVTILSKEVSFGEDIGKTFTNATDVKQPILEIGDGLNTGVISSHGSRTLLLKTGDTNTYNSWIAVLKGGGITANVEHTKPYNIMFNSSGTGAGKLRVKNRNTDGGNASLSFIVNHTNSDGFVKYKYTDASDASNDIQWVHGFDGSDSDTFKLNYVSGDSDSTVCTPSNGNTRFSVTSAGNATISSDLTVSGGDIVLGTDLDGSDKTITFGHSTLKTIMGIDDSADAFVINTDAAFDGTLANNSFSIDASHNVIVAGTLTSSAGVCGGPKVTNHVTNDADDTMAGALTISKEGTQLKLEYNANDYATLAVADTGDLTIATVGDGTTDSDLTLDADGDIFLDAVCASGTGIKLKNAGTLFGFFDIHHSASHLKLFENGGASSDDYFNLGVYANGATTITTLDAGGATAHLTLDIDGSIIFDPADGNYIAKNNGTEFSVANSAYAGMILGYTRLEGDVAGSGGEVTFEIQNSMTVEDASHEVTFKTPPSEKVEIEGICAINISSTDTKICVGLSDNSTYNSIGEQFEYDHTGIVFTDDEIDDHVITFKFVLEAAQLASVGSSNTFYIGFSTGGSTKTAYVAYGLRLPHNIAHHPFVLKATALPASIENGL